MTCGGCAASVKGMLEIRPQVSSASVNFTTETEILWPASEELLLGENELLFLLKRRLPILIVVLANFIALFVCSVREIKRKINGNTAYQEKVCLLEQTENSLEFIRF
ncbi:hypothetical protein DITRI_Ditri03aG0227500 [Diplodiscus trichospermus]